MKKILLFVMFFIIGYFFIEKNESNDVVEDGVCISYIDLDDRFNDLNGGIIFLDNQNEYVYNEEYVVNEFSPYSTFKIVSTLLGLQGGVVDDLSSQMNYSGTTYWYDKWNNNVTLEEAFDYSCVWYYYQLIHHLDIDYIDSYLKLLSYGNLNISEFEGNGKNIQYDLNGFWLDSSLKISPREQVYVLQTIFESSMLFDSDHIILLKELMNIDGTSIYGKTGSGNDQSWFVGFFENNSDIIYFACFIDNGSSSEVKSLCIDLIDKYIKNNPTTKID